jgi:hypothetical protein
MFRSQSKSKSKSLRVQRETLRTLGGAELGAAQGGGAQVGQRAFFTQDATCPRIPDIQLPNVSMTAPGNGCGGQLPSISIIVNPLP